MIENPRFFKIMIGISFLLMNGNVILALYERFDLTFYLNFTAAFIIGLSAWSRLRKLSKK
ncbi:hypothetical protein CJ305_13580 [Leeuwenhoekiella nanhaiensis]|uniref:Uncharacterized protein n=1 Tax=Leeuwenhoekiella nanhaiensis TaxID=1655491 RepID=A0A2G1VPZ6_9FLAO|nr:hypothetical protein CJ305_13580 [Leeuwenhoekiella nanhaiensis]